jgi:hypothetical protein
MTIVSLPLSCRMVSVLAPTRPGGDGRSSIRPNWCTRSADMNWSKLPSVSVVLAAQLLAGQAFSQVQFQQNRAGQTTELSGLYADQSCSSVDIKGRVVKRDFASDALSITGFVVERRDGTRQFVNVSIPSDLSMVARSVVDDGLQRLLREGREVRASCLACGAAGRVLTLERIN